MPSVPRAKARIRIRAAGLDGTSLPEQNHTRSTQTISLPSDPNTPLESSGAAPTAFRIHFSHRAPVHAELMSHGGRDIQNTAACLGPRSVTVALAVLPFFLLVI